MYYFYYSLDGDVLVSRDETKQSSYFLNTSSTKCITLDGDGYEYDINNNTVNKIKE